ncbi:MBL fold metallo-hydrolase [Clostridium baratii]|uniref:MBL fold metallo-hydrolase n=1 Tax=Clostridium baratii TaxID=1561 RepID=UPI0030CC80B2
MKITTIIENEATKLSNLYNEHGLCYFIEIDGLNILFDTGKSYKAYENFKKLGLDDKKIDYIILSHGHYDHTGGLKVFLENIKCKPKIIVGNEFFSRKDKYHLKENNKKYIGIDFNLKYLKEKNIEIIEVKESIKLTDKINLISNLKGIDERNILEGEDVLAVKYNNSLIRDDFREELVIAIERSYSIILITGCAHNKIQYIAKYIKNKFNKSNLIIIGGVHLSNATDKEINEAIDNLKEINIKKISLCHCSGHKIIEKLKAEKIEVTRGITGTISEY